VVELFFSYHAVPLLFLSLLSLSLSLSLCRFSPICRDNTRPIPATMSSVPTPLKGVLPPTPVLLGTALILYSLGLLIYRLFLHPLARFPGPKIAAVTSFYEGWFEIVRKGQYSKEISRLHDVYGEWGRNR
jgi:hypothetical protein